VVGIGQHCHGKEGAAAALSLAGAAELGTAIYVGTHVDGGFEHPGAALPLAAWQDTWLLGVGDMLRDRQLARYALYTPTDSFEDLLAAPFNLEVMKRPKVWAGLLVALGVGIGASALLEGGFPKGDPGGDVNFFGKQVSPAVGIPGGLGVAGVLFSHVAPAEELLFRGVVQSEIARQSGETTGWLAGSLVFGAAHAPNAFLVEGEDRKRYLVYGLPVITAVGTYLGYLYRDSGYSLAPSTAVHFWYDFLLTSTFFIMDPQSSPISAQVGFRF
jgi:membrane protease YdiL (CAAX protease family)